MGKNLRDGCARGETTKDSKDTKGATVKVARVGSYAKLLRDCADGLEFRGCRIAYVFPFGWRRDFEVLYVVPLQLVGVVGDWSGADGFVAGFAGSQ